MTSPSITEHISGSIATGDLLTLASWTPDAHDLVLVGVHMDKDGITPAVAGNGLTFVLVASLTGGARNLWLFRAQRTVPTAGSITVTMTGNTSAAIVAAARIAGCDIAGTDGSSAVEVSATATGSDDSMQVAIVTASDHSLIVAWSGHSDAATFTVPGDETEVEIRIVELSVASDMWSLGAATPGAYTIGAAADLDTSDDWHVIAVAVKPLPPERSILPPVIRMMAA